MLVKLNATRMLCIQLSEGQVVRRFVTTMYADKILAILRAKRTGTLLLEGWELKGGEVDRYCGVEKYMNWGRFKFWRSPIFISLEDVRTFKNEELPDDQKHRNLINDTSKNLETFDQEVKNSEQKPWIPRS